MNPGCPMSAKFRWLPLLCLALAGCSQLENPGNVTAADKAARAPASDGENMVSINAADAPPAPAPPRSQAGRPWPQAQLENGRAWVSCSTEYAGDAGDGAELEGLQREQITQALAPCAERGLMRVRYAVKINPGFAEMMWLSPLDALLL